MRFYLKIDTLPLIFLHYKKNPSHDSNFPIQQLEFLRCIILRIIPFDFYATTPLSDFLGVYLSNYIIALFRVKLVQQYFGIPKILQQWIPNTRIPSVFKARQRRSENYIVLNFQKWKRMKLSFFFPRCLHAYSNHSSLDCSSIYKRIQK